MNRAQALELMQRYYEGDGWSVGHAQKVLGYAEQVLGGEQVTDRYLQQVVVLAAIFHDVGIPVAKQKYGTAAGPYQEQEGEPVARRLLTELGIRPDILERVCYIVGHHHSHEKVDGLDFQIIWESDALVNIPSRPTRPTPEQIPEIIERNFVTTTGRDLITKILVG